jgi:hypothetical protein
MFPTEAVGKDLCYKVRMSTTHVGDTPILYNITFHYLYCNPPSVTFTGQTAGDKFGFSVSAAGNIGRGLPGDDGIDDIVIGAPFRNSGAGAVYIFNGSATLSGTVSADNADYVIGGTQAGEHYGWSVSKAGDLDSDGYNDVIVGAPEKGPSSSADGTGWVQVIVIPEFQAMLIAVIVPFGLSVIVFRKKRKAKTA